MSNNVCKDIAIKDLKDIFGYTIHDQDKNEVLSVGDIIEGPKTDPSDDNFEVAYIKSADQLEEKALLEILKPLHFNQNWGVHPAKISCHEGQVKTIFAYDYRKKWSF